MKNPDQTSELDKDNDDDTLAVQKLRLQRDQFEFEKTKSGRISTAQLTLLASILSFVSALAGGAITGWFTTRTEEVKGDTTINLERVKFETSLIIKAIITDDQSKAIQTLKSFANAGLIPSFEGRVASLTQNNNGAAVPALEGSSPKPGRLPWNKGNVLISHYIGYISEKGSAECNVTFVDKKHFVLPTHCVATPYSTVDLTVTIGNFIPQLNSIRLVPNMVEQISIPVTQLSSVSDHLTLGTLGKENPLMTYVPQFRLPERSEEIKVVYVALQGSYTSSFMMLQDKCAVLELSSPFAVGSLRGDFAYRCDTPQGTSGSPIISVADGSIVGLVEGSGGGVDLGAQIPIESVRMVISHE